MWKFQESVKREVEIPGVFKKNSRGISIDLGFWLWNFQGASYNSSEFPGGDGFYVISKGKVKNLKIPLGGFRKVYSISPLLCLDFFWNSPIHVRTRQLLTNIEKSIITLAKKLPTSILYGTQILVSAQINVSNFLV